MFGWLSRRDKSAGTPAIAAAEGLIAEGKRAEDAGDAVRARELYRQAVAAAPHLAAAHFSLGKVLRALGQLPEAAAELRAGLAAHPDDLQARALLFHVLELQGDNAAAVIELEHVLRLRPDWTQALYNYGTTLMALRRDAQAEAALRGVLERDPTFVLAYRMLGSLLHRHGCIEETLALCAAGRKALPENRDLESFELFALNFSDRVTDDELFARHTAFGQRLEASVPARFTFPPPAKRKLRVGYVSPDLSYHPVGLFLLPVLERHDRARVEAYCYATGPQVDDFTRRLRAAAGAWREAHSVSDAELADRIHADGIDILVDLAGHSGVSRLGVFAQKPAPVQAAWLGYLNTTGLTRIDYRITDRYCDPEGATDARHTEQLVRLPHSQWCYRPFVDVAPKVQAPSVRNGFVTFGAFTQTAKLSPTTLQLWAHILREVPTARLLIAGVVAAERVHIALEQAGIERSRVELAPFLPVKEYLRLFDRIDIGLDPLPYSGGTSTCDALWMGVPVLTLPGARPASRSAASILTSIGLDDWIAQDRDDYLRRAAAFANDPHRIIQLRQTLRGRMQASPLTDEPGFTRAFEDAFESMWGRR